MSHSIYGSAVPPGTWSVYTDGTPGIVLGETFYKYGGVLPTLYCLGGRVWTPAGSPSTVTLKAWSASTGVRDPDVAPNDYNLETTPLQTKTVPTNVGGWTEATWDTPFTFPDDGYRVMVGYSFPTAPYTYVAATDAYSAGGANPSGPVFPADGFHLVKSDSKDMSTTYGPIFRSYYRIDVNTPRDGLAATGYGIDILASTTLAPTLHLGSVIVSGTKHPVSAASVIVSGAKKAVSGMYVISGGAKKPTT